MVEFYRPRLGPNRFRVLLLLLVWVGTSLFFYGESHAKTTQDERARAYQRAALQQVLKPMFPEGLDEVKFVFKRLHIHGATVYEQKHFWPFYKKHLKQEVTLRHIYEIAQKITNKYRSDGYLLSKAIVSSQQIQNGTAHIRIHEGYIDKIQIKGPVRGPRKLLDTYRKEILRSRPLRTRDLERYLLLIDDLPGVSAKSALIPSEDKLGASDLTLTFKDKAFADHVSANSRGSEFSGSHQFPGEANTSSLSGKYKDEGIQGVMASQAEDFLFMNASTDLPVSQAGTRLFFSSSIIRPEPSSTFGHFEVGGDRSTITMRLTYPFLRSRSENLVAYLGLTSREPVINTLGVVDSENRQRALDMGVSYTAADQYMGINLFQFNLNKGLNIFDATELDSKKLLRAQKKNDSTRVSGRFMRLQSLASDWSLLGAMSWRYDFDKSPVSEEFGADRARFGRAYGSSKVAGNQGLAFNMELQKTLRPKRDYLSSLQLYGFFDYGSVWNGFETSAGNRREDRTSAGIGMRFNLNESISGYAELDKPFSSKMTTEGDKQPRLFFNLSKRF
jgi:hemolysin activation/secretion protein